MNEREAARLVDWYRELEDGTGAAEGMPELLRNAIAAAVFDVAFERGAPEQLAIEEERSRAKRLRKAQKKWDTARRQAEEDKEREARQASAARAADEARRAALVEFRAEAIGAWETSFRASLASAHAGTLRVGLIVAALLGAGIVGIGVVIGDARTIFLMCAAAAVSALIVLSVCELVGFARAVRRTDDFPFGTEADPPVAEYREVDRRISGDRLSRIIWYGVITGLVIATAGVGFATVTPGPWTLLLAILFVLAVTIGTPVLAFWFWTVVSVLTDPPSPRWTLRRGT